MNAILAAIISVGQLIAVVFTCWFIYYAATYLVEAYYIGMNGADFLLGFLLLFFMMKLLNTAQSAAVKRMGGE